MRIHFREIERFGGSPGIRDEGLLESALAQPQATFGGEFLQNLDVSVCFPLLQALQSAK